MQVVIVKPKLVNLLTEAVNKLKERFVLDARHVNPRLFKN